MVRLVDPAIHATTHVLDKCAEDPAVESCDCEVAIDNDLAGQHELFFRAKAG
jgi:hypothetical protein